MRSAIRKCNIGRDEDLDKTERARLAIRATVQLGRIAGISSDAAHARMRKCTSSLGRDQGSRCSARIAALNGGRTTRPHERPFRGGASGAGDFLQVSKLKPVYPATASLYRLTSIAGRSGQAAMNGVS
jgi:hypothetical protein